MRLGIVMSAAEPFEDVSSAARQAEGAGADAIYLPAAGRPSTGDGLAPRLEPWSTLAALAVLVGRVRLGVVGERARPSDPPPALLAKAASALDRLSGGRVVLGLAAARSHGDGGTERLDEACQVLRLLLSAPRSDFSGRYFSLHDAPCEPKPLQTPLPLRVAAGDEGELRVVAARADEWDAASSPGELKPQIALLERLCGELGRDPSTIARTATIAPCPVRPGELERLAESYRSLGVDELVVAEPAGGERADGLRALEELRRHVE